MDVKFIKTTQSKLNSVSVVNGQIICLEDSPHIYYDMGGARRRSLAISDNYTVSAGAASSGVVASSKAVADLYNYTTDSLSPVTLPTSYISECTSGVSVAGTRIGNLVELRIYIIGSAMSTSSEWISLFTLTKWKPIHNIDTKLCHAGGHSDCRLQLDTSGRAVIDVENVGCYLVGTFTYLTTDI